LSIGACLYRPSTPKRVWVVGAVCSMIPDLDVIGFRFGIRYGDFLGHRGFTHFTCLCRSSGECRCSHWVSPRSPRDGAVFPVVVLFPRHVKPRFTRRNDRWGPWCRILRTLQQLSVLSSLEADQGLTYQCGSLFYGARTCC